MLACTLPCHIDGLLASDLLSLVVELGSALRYSASQSVENATRVDDLAASAIKVCEYFGFRAAIEAEEDWHRNWRKREPRKASMS